MELIRSLLEIQIGSKLLLAALHRKEQINPVDYIYKALKITLEPLSETDLEYQKLLQYLLVNEPKSFLQTYHISILRLQRLSEPQRFARWKSLQNRMLLWHGSKTSNIVGILSQGLRIAPPEAPHTGFAFGKGIYFADCFKKSFNYCSPSVRFDQMQPQNNSFFMLLCEVALGNMNLISSGTYMGQPIGTHSTKGVGRRGPDFSQNVIFPNGVIVPLGPTYESPITENIRLQHNEYIVYDESQVQMRYLVHLSLKDPAKKINCSH